MNNGYRYRDTSFFYHLYLYHESKKRRRCSGERRGPRDKRTFFQRTLRHIYKGGPSRTSYERRNFFLKFRLNVQWTLLHRIKEGPKGASMFTLKFTIEVEQGGTLETSVKNFS